MEIKAGPGQHRRSQPVSRTFFVKPTRVPVAQPGPRILLQIALAAHCLPPMGHIRGVHQQICSHTHSHAIFWCPLRGKSCAAARWFVLSTKGSVQRTSCARVHTSLQSAVTHRVTSQSKSVIVWWSKNSSVLALAAVGGWGGGLHKHTQKHKHSPT